MKKILFIIIAFALSVQVLAQSGITSKQRNNARTIAFQQTSEMTRELGLSEAQQLKMQDVNLKLALTDRDLSSPYGKVRPDRSIDYSNRQDKMYKAILSHAQYEKWHARK